MAISDFGSGSISLPYFRFICSFNLLSSWASCSSLFRAYQPRNSLNLIKVHNGVRAEQKIIIKRWERHSRSEMVRERRWRGTFTLFLHTNTSASGHSAPIIIITGIAIIGVWTSLLHFRLPVTGLRLRCAPELISVLQTNWKSNFQYTNHITPCHGPPPLRLFLLHGPPPSPPAPGTRLTNVPAWRESSSVPSDPAHVEKFAHI